MCTIVSQINSLLYPYLLGYISMNNGGNFVVTNNDCTHFREIGGRKWQVFSFAPKDFDNHRLEIVTFDVLNSGACNPDPFFIDFQKREHIEYEFFAVKIVELCKPYFLALHGDLQGQYHYCLAKKDPLEIKDQQMISYIFPGTVFDLYDSVPEVDVAYASPFVGGSLGWLAHLTPLEDTLVGIIAAKKRLV